MPKANVESALKKVSYTMMMNKFQNLTLISGQRWEGTRGQPDCFIRGYGPWLSGYNDVSRLASLKANLLTSSRECLTDNSNRTIHKLREILNRHKYVYRTSPQLHVVNLSSEKFAIRTCWFSIREKGPRTRVPRQDSVGRHRLRDGASL